MKDIREIDNSIRDYLFAKDKLTNTPWKITPDGEAFYVVDGELIPDAEFIRLNPLPYLHEGKGFKKGCDGTKNFYE